MLYTCSTEHSTGHARLSLSLSLTHTQIQACKGRKMIWCQKLCKLNRLIVMIVHFVSNMAYDSVADDIVS